MSCRCQHSWNQPCKQQQSDEGAHPRLQQCRRYDCLLCFRSSSPTQSHAVGRPLAPYNLLWPVHSQRGPIPPGKVAEGSKEPPKRSSLRAAPTSALNPGTYDDLQEYARNLLASFPDPKATGVRIKLPIEAIPSSRSGDDSDLEGDINSPTGCRQAVEVLTRNPKKGMRITCSGAIVMLNGCIAM